MHTNDIIPHPSLEALLVAIDNRLAIQCDPSIKRARYFFLSVELLCRTIVEQLITIIVASRPPCSHQEGTRRSSSLK